MSLFSREFCSKDFWRGKCTDHAGRLNPVSKPDGQFEEPENTDEQEFQ